MQPQNYHDSSKTENPTGFRRGATWFCVRIYTRPITRPLPIEYYIISRHLMDLNAAQLELQITFLYRP